MPYKSLEKKREQQRRWRVKNRDKITEYNRNYREKTKARRNKLDAESRRDGFFSVYYLPKEHYVGMADGIKRRIYQHEYHGKDVEGWRVLRTFTNAFDAHIYETQWHKMGANGFQSKNDILDYGEESNQ